MSSAALYSVASLVGGAASGAVLGFMGSALSPTSRVGIGTLLGFLGVVIGGLDVLGRASPPLQCDRETPKRWVGHGATGWAIRNGLALGCGAGSRIGFWLWYAIPAGALLFGNAASGALLYGTYGAARGILAWPLMNFAKHNPQWDQGVWLLRKMPAAKALSASLLLFVSVFITVVVGA